MNPFPDTSFLCAIYRSQDNSPQADAYLVAVDGPLPVSTLLLLEFRQSVRLQANLHAQDRTRGYSMREGGEMLQHLHADITAGVLEVVPVDWADVHRVSELLIAKHTEAHGHRLVDILHVATALHLGMKEFLTFDPNQRQLAATEGLVVPV
jgi:predicted nucleic acid-binding protein